MPTYEITAPDGRKYRIEGPAGATNEQVRQQVLRQHPDAGGRQSAKPAAPKPTSHLQGIIEGVMKPWNNAARALESGVEAIGLGGAMRSANALLGMEPTVNAAERTQQNALARSPYRSSGAGKFVGNVLGTLPTMALPGGALVQGAAGGALLTDARDARGIATDAVIGGAAGKAGELVARHIVAPIAGKAVRAVRNAAGRTPPAPAVSDDIATLGRDAVVRAERFRRAGVSNPTTGMVTREPRAWNFERETAKAAGSGDEMLTSIKGVEDDLVAAARSLVNRQGGAIGSEATGQRTAAALSAKNSEMQDAVGALYKGVRDNVGDARVPALENLKSAQSHPDWADNNEFDLMAAAVNKRLARYADADGGAAGLTVKQAEELRKFIGGLGPNSSQTYSMRRILQDGLDADVIDELGGAPFAQARAAARSRFEEFSKTLAGKIGEGSVAPEQLTKRLLSRGTKLSDLRSVRQSLTTGTPEQVAQGSEALRTIGAQSLDDLFTRGISPDGKVNGGALYRQFQELAPRLRIILGADGYKQARRLVQVARDATTEVPFSAVNNSNSASAIGNMYGNALVTPSTGMKMIPGLARRAAGVVVGGSVGGVPGALVGDAAAETANRAIAQRASKATAQNIAGQVSIARSPRAAAKAINQMAQDKATNEAVRQFAKQIGQALSAPATAGATALTAQQP